MSFNVSNNTNDYSFFNSFFGGSSDSSGGIGTSNLLSDYFSVKNGTYLKLAKKYYASEAGESKKSSSSSKLSTADEKKVKLTQEAAKKAVGSLKDLMDNDLFKKVETTDADGNKVKDYDRKTILKNLKSFIEDYNSVLDNAGEMEDGSVLKNTLRMIQETEVYAKSLSKIGITIGKDNKLSIDEEKFGEADLLEAKNLFTGSISFASNIASKLTKIYNSSTSVLNSSGGIYSSQAKTGLTTGDMFDSMF